MKYKWNSILKEDMEYIISNAKKELTFLSNRKVLFTGGCGFIGYYFYNVIYFWNQKFKKKK